MGSRANMILVKGGNWKHYYDHRCALRQDQELFWGPELATQFIEQAPALNDRTEWLDETWCEGAAIIDHDRRTLLWFGGEVTPYDIPARREFLKLMQRQWPNWVIRWAMGGIVEIGAYLGIPAEHFVVAQDDSKLPGIHVATGLPDLNGMLLTVRENDAHGVARVNGNERLIQVGSKQVRTLKSIRTQPAIQWTGEQPSAGLHLDLDEQAIHFWLARPAVEIAARTQAAWPGWKINWLEDQFEEQLDLSSADIQLPLRSTIDLQLAILEEMGRDWPVQNVSALNELATETAEAEDETDPGHDCRRETVVSRVEKWQILDGLKEEAIERSGLT